MRGDKIGTNGSKKSINNNDKSRSNDSISWISSSINRSNRYKATTLATFADKIVLVASVSISANNKSRSNSSGNRCRDFRQVYI